jgi:hypothetical protein
MKITFSFVFLAMTIVAGDSWAECSKELARDGRSPVPVFVVTTSAEGFTQTKQTADSTEDLIKSLKDKKGICLTRNRDDAIVVVEVLGREKAQVTATWAGTGRDVTVAAKIMVGTFEAVLSESAAGGTLMAGGAWSKAAGKVAKRIEEWVRDNRAKLISESS